MAELEMVADRLDMGPSVRFKQSDYVPAMHHGIFFLANFKVANLQKKSTIFI